MNDFLDNHDLLRKTENIKEYVEHLKVNNNRFIVIISVKDTPGVHLSKEIASLFNEIGIKSDLHGKHGHSYIGIIYKGNVIKDELSRKNESLITENLVIDEGIVLNVFSSIYTKENLSVIMINDKDYSPNRRGLNIVVYDCVSKTVIDSVVFDTHVKPYKTIHTKNDTDIITGMKYAIGYHLLSQDINNLKRETINLKDTVKNAENKLEMLLWFLSGQVGESQIQTKTRFFSSLPEAEEPLRSVQKCGELLLKGFDKICTENKIDYFITSGTLLGAVRHTKFIPWDDDIDICMDRSNFYKLKKCLEKNDDYVCQEVFKAIGGPKIKYFAKRYIFKFKMHDEKLRLFMDIFILDYADDKVIEKIDKINNIRKTITKMYYTSSLSKIPSFSNNVNCSTVIKESDTEFAEYSVFFDKYLSEYTELLGEKDEKKFLVWAIDNDNYWFGNKRVFYYDSIYPLKRIRFGDHDYFAPNRPIDILSMLYGNIYDIPDNMVVHKHFSKSDEDIRLINSILDKYG